MTHQLDDSLSKPSSNSDGLLFKQVSNSEGLFDEHLNNGALSNGALSKGAPGPRFTNKASWGPLALILAMVLTALGGCDQPLAVQLNVSGAKDLALKGENGVTGIITRSLVYEGKTFPKGTKVMVSETFLVRREGGAPPSYHFKGLYDPAKRADGFMLPSDSVDTYYYAALEPDRRKRLPVPKAYFKPDP